MGFRFDLILIVVIGIAILIAMHGRRRVHVRAERGACFAECLDLFESVRIDQDDVDFPVLRGTYRGFPITLTPLVDHVAVRKLPSLWLLATLHADSPFKGTVDFLVRPQNVEFYSPYAGLPHDLPIPPAWPVHALLRTDNPDTSPPLDRLTPHIGLFDDTRAKELVVAPRGIRAVYQAHQAKRAEYLVLRQAEFDDVRIDRNLVRGLLDRLIALHHDLTGSPARAA